MAFPQQEHASVRIFVGPLCDLGERTLRIWGSFDADDDQKLSRSQLSCYSRKGKAATTRSEIASTVIQSIMWQGGARRCARRPAVRW
jgi:hypothetical protein